MPINSTHANERRAVKKVWSMPTSTSARKCNTGKKMEIKASVPELIHYNR